jgi:hypothetical protein
MMLAQTELHQLLKFPVLTQHFAEHKKQNPETSILSFVILHYFSGTLHDKDYEKDMQLPFKTADCAAAINFALAPSGALTIPEPVYYVTKEYPALMNTNIPTIHHADIWQPPKFL